MNCPDALPRIHALLDGEISPADRVELEQHLEGCAHCRIEADSARKLIETIRKSVSPSPPSLTLRTRLRDALDREDRRGSRRRLAFAAAAGLLLTASAIFALQYARVIRTPEVIAATVRAFNAMNQGQMPILDPERMSQTFRQVNLDVPTPRCSMGTLVGGCCCTFECAGTQSVPCMLYNSASGKVALWVFDAPIGKFREADRRKIQGLDAYCYSMEGKTAIACVGPEAMHVWVSDLDADSLASFVRDSDEARTTPEGSLVLPVTGMNCLMCASRAREAIESLPGVRDAWISLSRGEAVVFSERPIDRAAVYQALGRFGFREPERHSSAQPSKEKNER